MDTTISPRVRALEEMWHDFAHEHHMEIKEMVPMVSPWWAINHWSARFADYILDQSPEMIEMATRQQQGK